MLHQIVSLVGAGLILGAYGANQAGVVGPTDRSYNLANLIGALLLLWIAVVDWRIGFILLEVTWALLSLPHLLRPNRADPPEASA